MSQVEDFLAYLRTERNFSAHSLKNYAVDLREVADFLTEHQGEWVKDGEVQWEKLPLLPSK